MAAEGSARPIRRSCSAHSALRKGRPMILPEHFSRRPCRTVRGLSCLQPPRSASPMQHGPHPGAGDDVLASAGADEASPVLVFWRLTRSGSARGGDCGRFHPGRYAQAGGLLVKHGDAFGIQRTRSIMSSHLDATWSSQRRRADSPRPLVVRGCRVQVPAVVRRRLRSKQARCPRQCCRCTRTAIYGLPQAGSVLSIFIRRPDQRWMAILKAIQQRTSEWPDRDGFLSSA